MAEGVHSGITRTKIVRRNFQKGDLVLLKVDSSRNHWPIACIIETFPNKQRIAQSIKLRLGDVVSADQRELVRSIAKIVLLVESDSLTKNLEKIAGCIGGAR